MVSGLFALVEALSRAAFSNERFLLFFCFSVLNFVIYLPPVSFFAIIEA